MEWINKIMSFVGIDTVEDENFEYEEKDFTSNAENKTKITNLSDYKSKNKNDLSLNTENIYVLKEIALEPENFEDAKDIVDEMKNGKHVTVRLNSLDAKIVQRVNDFVSGAVYALEWQVLNSGLTVQVIPPKVKLENNFKTKEPFNEILDNSRKINKNENSFNNRQNNNIEQIVLGINKYEDSKLAADKLKLGKSVTIILSSLSNEIASRVIDFLSGAIYVLDLSAEKISDKVFIIASKNLILINELGAKEPVNEILKERDSFKDENSEEIVRRFHI